MIFEARFISGGTIQYMEHSEPSFFGQLGRRIVAWIVLIAVAVIALKIVFGIVAGIVMAIFWAAVVAALIFAAVWALRRV
jgi:hypothetical protein